MNGQTGDAGVPGLQGIRGQFGEKGRKGQKGATGNEGLSGKPGGCLYYQVIVMYWYCAIEKSREGILLSWNTLPKIFAQYLEGKVFTVMIFMIF